jgi:hypothetical protein
MVTYPAAGPCRPGLSAGHAAGATGMQTMIVKRDICVGDQGMAGVDLHQRQAQRDERKELEHEHLGDGKVSAWYLKQLISARHSLGRLDRYLLRSNGALDVSGAVYGIG